MIQLNNHMIQLNNHKIQLNNHMIQLNNYIIQVNIFLLIQYCKVKNTKNDKIKQHMVVVFPEYQTTH